MLKITHMNVNGSSWIINNGSCISTVVYSDYSGLTKLLDRTKPEFKKFVKSRGYIEYPDLEKMADNIEKLHGIINDLRSKLQ